MDKKNSLNPAVPYEDFDWDSFEEDVAESVQEDTRPSAPARQFIPENEIVEGVVTSISRREVIVDIGAKCEGAIAAPEFRYNPDLKVGDEVEVLVESLEDRNGQLRISHKKARQLMGWDRITAAYEKRDVVKGFVKTRTKGGLIVDVFSLDAFLPDSQIDTKPIQDFDSFVNTTMDLKIIRIDEAFRNVVVSHKVLLEEERSKDTPNARYIKASSPNESQQESVQSGGTAMGDFSPESFFSEKALIMMKGKDRK